MVEADAPVPKWRRFARALMPWDKDPALAVMGGFLLLVIVGGTLALVGLIAYVCWQMAPDHPVPFAIAGGLLCSLLALVWLVRSRCPQCKRFFAAQRTATEVDHAATPSTIRSATGGRVQVTGERVVVVRHYRCRRCDARFSRRS